MCDRHPARSHTFFIPFHFTNYRPTDRRSAKNQTLIHSIGKNVSRSKATIVVIRTSTVRAGFYEPPISIYVQSRHRDSQQSPSPLPLSPPHTHVSFLAKSVSLSSVMLCYVILLRTYRVFALVTLGLGLLAVVVVPTIASIILQCNHLNQSSFFQIRRLCIFFYYICLLHIPYGTKTSKSHRPYHIL